MYTHKASTKHRKTDTDTKRVKQTPKPIHRQAADRRHGHTHTHIPHTNITNN